MDKPRLPEPPITLPSAIEFTHPETGEVARFVLKRSEIDGALIGWVYLPDGDVPLWALPLADQFVAFTYGVTLPR